MTSIAQRYETRDHNLARMIQGYEGYESADQSLHTEQRLKSYLADQLRRVEINLSQFEHRCYQQRKLSNLNSFNRISLSLKMLIQSLQEAATNHQAIPAPALHPSRAMQLEQQDQHLVEQVTILSDEIESLDELDGEFEIDEMLNHLYDLLDGINQTLSEREFLMMND